MTLFFDGGPAPGDGQVNDDAIDREAREAPFACAGSAWVLSEGRWYLLVPPIQCAAESGEYLAARSSVGPSVAGPRYPESQPEPTPLRLKDSARRLRSG